MCSSDHAAQEAFWRTRLFAVAFEGETNRTTLSGAQVEPVGRNILLQIGRRRIEGEGAAAQFLVETFIGNIHAAGFGVALYFRSAAPVPMQPADFEKVGEIAVKSERDAELNAGVAVVVETESVVNAATPKKQRAHDMNGVFGQRKLPAEIHIRIGQVDGKHRIIVAHI